MRPALTVSYLFISGSQTLPLHQCLVDSPTMSCFSVCTL